MRVVMKRGTTVESVEVKRPRVEWASGAVTITLHKGARLEFPPQQAEIIGKLLIGIARKAMKLNDTRQHEFPFEEG